MDVLRKIYTVKALKLRKNAKNPGITVLGRCECFSLAQAEFTQAAYWREYAADDVVIEQYSEPQNQQQL